MIACFGRVTSGQNSLHLLKIVVIDELALIHVFLSKLQRGTAFEDEHTSSTEGSGERRSSNTKITSHHMHSTPTKLGLAGAWV